MEGLSIFAQLFRESIRNRLSFYFYSRLVLDKVIILRTCYEMTMNGVAELQIFPRNENQLGKLVKLEKLLLTQKYVSKIEGKRKIVNGEVFEEAANLGP